MQALQISSSLHAPGAAGGRACPRRPPSSHTCGAAFRLAATLARPAPRPRAASKPAAAAASGGGSGGSGSESSMTLFSPSKVNLFLRVVRRREDGFHDLASLFHVRASYCRT